MPVIIAILGVLGAAIFWIYRARGAVDAGKELVEVANDVRLAARRFGFRRNHNRHPVEDIEDPNIAIGGIAVSFLEFDDYPTQEQRNAMLRSMQSALHIDLTAAEELSILGRWFMTECGGPDATITRLSKKLNKMSGARPLEPLMRILNEIAKASAGDMNDRQREALADISRAFKL